MRKRVLGLLAAAVLAILGTILIVTRVNDASQREAAGQQLADVLVMNEFVPAGTSSAELADFVRTDGVPIALLAEGAVTSLDDVAGLVTLADLGTNEQVTSARFGTAAEAARVGTIEIPADRVEITVSMTPDRSVGGAVQPGDSVSVIAAFDEGEQPENSVGLLRGDVLVTRVQGAEPVEIDAAVADDGTPTPAPTAESLVTLAVTGADAERLIYAVEYGRLYLARQPLDAAEFLSRITTAENVFKGR